MQRRHFIKTSAMVAIGLPMLQNTLVFKKLNSKFMKNEFDVIIIGGSYAGLSAAMALGRSLRQVLIIDSGLPCNRFTTHAHNFITHDGTAPAEIARQARQDVERYDSIYFQEGLAVGGTKTEAGFEIKTQDNEVFLAKKLIFATGIRDILPEIPGLAECWGKTVVHCPYCHGYEFRQQKTGIIAVGKRAFHLASLVNNLTGDLTIFTSGKADLEDAQLAKLNSRGIKLEDAKISNIEHENGQVKYVVFKDGSKAAFDALYAAIPFAQHSEIPVSLGCELTEQGYLKVNNFQQTTIDGVYACGDNSSMMRSVASAVYSGNLTGAMVNGFLTEEQF